MADVTLRVISEDNNSEKKVTLTMKGIIPQDGDIDTTALQTTLAKLNLDDQLHELLILNKNSSKGTAVIEEEKEDLKTSLEKTCEKLEILTISNNVEIKQANEGEAKFTESRSESTCLSEKEHGRREEEHGQREEEHDRREEEHCQREEEHDRREEEHGRREEEHDRREGERCQREEEHDRREEEHGRREEEHDRREVEPLAKESENSLTTELVPVSDDASTVESLTNEEPTGDKSPSVVKCIELDVKTETTDIDSVEKKENELEEPAHNELEVKDERETDTVQIEKPTEEDPTLHKESKPEQDAGSVTKSTGDEFRGRSHSDSEEEEDSGDHGGEECSMIKRGPAGRPTYVASGQRFGGAFEERLHDISAYGTTQQATIQMTRIYNPPQVEKPLVENSHKRKPESDIPAFVKFIREHEEPEENECGSYMDWAVEVEERVQQARRQRTEPKTSILESIIRGNAACESGIQPPLGGYPQSNSTMFPEQSLPQHGNQQWAEMAAIGGSPPREQPSSVQQLPTCRYAPTNQQQAVSIIPHADILPTVEENFPASDYSVYLSPSYSPHSEQLPPSNQSASSHSRTTSQSSEPSPLDALTTQATSPYSDIFSQAASPDPATVLPSPSSSNQSYVPSPSSESNQDELDLLNDVLYEEEQKEAEIKMAEEVMRELIRDSSPTAEPPCHADFQRVSSYPNLFPTLEHPLDPSEIEQYREPDDGDVQSKPSVYDTPQSSPSDSSYGDGRDNLDVLSPASCSSSSSSNNSGGVQDSDTESKSFGISSEQVREKLKNVVTKRLETNGNMDTSSLTKPSVKPPRGRPCKPNCGTKEERPKATPKVDPHLQAKKLQEYRPIKSKLDRIQPTVVLPPSCVPVFLPNGVQMNNLTMAENEPHHKEEQAKASRRIAQMPPHKLRAIDNDGDTLLHCICYEECVEDLVKALTQGEDDDDDSILSMGIMKGIYIVRALVERLKRENIIDDLINRRNKQGQSPLLLACITNEPVIVQILLEKGADPNMNVYHYSPTDGTKRFYAPIHYVCERAQFNQDVLKVLLEHGKTDVNKTNYRMETALHVAIKNHGAAYEDPKKKKDGYKDSRGVVRMLLERRALLTKGPNDQNPLHYVASLDLKREPREYLAFLKYVLQLIPDVTQRKRLLEEKSDKGTVLHIVAAKAFSTPEEKQVIMDSLKYLIDHCGANPTIKDKSDFPVKRNVHKHDPAIMEYLTNKIKAANRIRNNIAQKNAAAQAKPSAAEVIPVTLSTMQVPTASWPASHVQPNVGQIQVQNSGVRPLPVSATTVSAMHAGNLDVSQIQTSSDFGSHFGTTFNPVTRLPDGCQGTAAQLCETAFHQTVPVSNNQQLFTISGLVLPQQTVTYTQPGQVGTNSRSPVFLALSQTGNCSN